MNRSDLDRNAYMLCGPLAKRGYLRWWHSFRGKSCETGIWRRFFVDYLIQNPVPGKRKRGEAPVLSCVRISAGVFPGEGLPGVQLISQYPISVAKFAKKPLYFQVEDNVLRENRITGSVSDTLPEPGTDSEKNYVLEWDLEILKTIACHTGILASPLLSALRALDSFWHGEGIKTHFRGTITLNDETFEVSAEDCSGYADKHWGQAFNKPWLQLASCDLVSERTGKPLKHSALAIDGCCPRFLFFHFKPKMLLQLTYTGEDFCYSFTKPQRRPRLKWCTKERRDSYAWQIKAADKQSLIKVTLHSSKTNMMPLYYDSPDGSTSPRLRAGAEGYGTLDLYRITPTGRIWVDTLTIQNALCILEKPTKKAP